MSRGRLIWTLVLVVALAWLILWYVTGFRATEPSLTDRAPMSGEYQPQ